MKQHLEESDLKSLSDKGRNKLITWVRKHHESSYLNLTIGEMIEYLAGKKEDIHIEHLYGYWDISTCYDEKWKFNDKGKQKKGLCDVLWEAVKESLEK